MMLRRLGLTKDQNGNAPTGQNGEVGTFPPPTAVFAPRVDYHVPTRYFKVIYRGAVAVRANPAEPAPEDGQCFSFGDVIEVCGLAVAVPEGVLVEVKQPKGGWVFQRHGDRTLLEEVEALKVVEGDWWYRVIHPNGAHFVKIPSLLTKAPRHTPAVPQNTVVHACRRHTPPGSSVSFVELSDNKGWIVESAADGTMLDRAADGKPVVEHITGEYRDESEAWYRVISPDGVELLEGPDLEGGRKLEKFLPGKAFCVSQRFQPPGQASTYVKVKDREAWVLQASETEEEDLCEKLPPPMDEVVEQWYRVEYPGGVRLRNSPSFDHTDPSLGVLVCGWVFLATRRFRAPGSSHMFLQVATPEGVVREDSKSDLTENGPGNGERGVAERRCGWVPSDAEGSQVVVETMEPWIERGIFAYQVVLDETVAAATGPHTDAPRVLQHLPPYSVAAVATFFETGDGSEGYVQLAGSGSWVLARQGQQSVMDRLPGFPEVDKTLRRFVVTATDGVETIVGPSSYARHTGQVLPSGTEGRSEMVWFVKGWPGDRGQGDKKFVLLEGMGWIELSVGRGESQLEEVDLATRRSSVASSSASSTTAGATGEVEENAS